MTKILVIGAGRSATSLIDYLLKNATENGWQITVADLDINLAKQKIHNYSNARAIEFNTDNSDVRRSIIKDHDFNKFEVVDYQQFKGPR
jgi:saccharopine dehydrogenase (NADP+, L-glutamate forming)